MIFLGDVECCYLAACCLESMQLRAAYCRTKSEGWILRCLQRFKSLGRCELFPCSVGRNNSHANMCRGHVLISSLDIFKTLLTGRDLLFRCSCNVY
jgi:hypothetical protein